MEWAALVTWVITALFGFTMLVIWIRHGGLQGSSAKIPPWLVLSHFALAASGLVLWLIYVATDTDALAWIAFIVLLAGRGARLDDVLRLGSPEGCSRGSSCRRERRSRWYGAALPVSGGRGARSLRSDDRRARPAYGDRVGD